MNKSRIRSNWLLIVAAVILIAIIAIVALTGLDLSGKPVVGFIMTGSRADGGWNGMHYNGITAACSQYDVKLEIEENVAEGTGQCAEAVDRLVKKGADMIILSSYGYPDEVKELIDEYPDIAFYGISAEYQADNMTSYFGRVYQARYLAGIIAAMTTESHTLGYVAAMSNNEVNRGINAFTLGARSVDPDIKVDVIFTGTWDDEEMERAAAAQLMEQYGADVLTYHQNQHYVAEAADEAGVYSIGYNEAVTGLSDKYLTAVVWDWESLYCRIVKELLQGSANSVLRHWFGIDTGAVGLADYSALVSSDAIAAVKAAETAIMTGKDAFTGVIYDNSGELRCDADEKLSDEILFEKMDWFVDGVVIHE